MFDNNQTSYVYSTRNCQLAKFFVEETTQCSISCKKFCKLILFWCHESLKRRVVNGTESNGINLFSWIREIMEQRLSYRFISSNSYHFFNRTDLKQYIFEVWFFKGIWTDLYLLYCRTALKLRRGKKPKLLNQIFLIFQGNCWPFVYATKSEKPNYVCKSMQNYTTILL